MNKILEAHVNRYNTRRGVKVGARALTAVAIAVSMTALSGCGMRIVDTASSPSPVAEAPSTQPEESTPESSAPADPTTLPSRTDFTGLAQQSLLCTTEPLEVSAVGVIVELTGPCADVTISSSGAVVLADKIDSLTVTGVGNTVFVGSVDLLGVTGDGNVVLWSDQAPVIDDSGVSNVLTKESS